MPRSYTSGGEASPGTGVVVAPGPAGGDPDKSPERKEEERDDVAAGFGVVRGDGGGDGALAEAALDPGGRGVTQAASGGGGGGKRGHSRRGSGRRRMESMDWSWSSEFGAR